MSERVETGKVQIGDDWSGVFIRGDNAIYYAMTLRAALVKAGDSIDPLTQAVLRGLANTLELVLERNGIDPVLLAKVQSNKTE